MCCSLVSIVRSWTCSLSCFWYMCLAGWKVRYFFVFYKKKKKDEIIFCWIVLWQQHRNKNTRYCGVMQTSACFFADGMTTILVPSSRFQPSFLSHSALDPKGAITTDKARFKEKLMINSVDCVGFKAGFCCKGNKHFLCSVPTSGLLAGKHQRRGKRIYRSCGWCWIKAINQNVKTVILGQTKSL